MALPGTMDPFCSRVPWYALHGNAWNGLIRSASLSDVRRPRVGKLLMCQPTWPLVSGMVILDHAAGLCVRHVQRERLAHHRFAAPRCISQDHASGLSRAYRQPNRPVRLSSTARRYQAKLSCQKNNILLYIPQNILIDILQVLKTNYGKMR